MSYISDKAEIVLKFLLTDSTNLLIYRFVWYTDPLIGTHLSDLRKMMQATAITITPPACLVNALEYTGVMAVDLTCRVTYVNAAMCATLALTREAVVGQELWTVVPDWWVRHLTPEEVLKWIHDTQERNARAKHSHA